MDATPLSRRDWMSSAVALGVSTLALAARPLSLLNGQELVLNSRGGYRFLPGLPFLSFGARAADGFEIARATFQRLRPFSQGIADIERVLRAAGRPIHALCGLELRSERQVSGAEFSSFNRYYLERIGQAGLLVGDQAPMVRTNVAVAGVHEHSIHAFCYTVPAASRQPVAAPTFVLAAVPEVRNITTQPEVVAAGDTTLEGLRLKTEFVLATLDGTMKVLGAQWAEVTGIQLYTIHDLQPLLADLILPRVGTGGRRGIEWHYASPPVLGGALEIDVRGTRLELLADA